MHRCIKNKDASTQKILVTDDNKIIGINLGYDFSIYHERGINNIRKFFNIDNYELGIKGYSIQKKDMNDYLIFNKVIINNREYIILLFNSEKKLKDLENVSADILKSLNLYPYENDFELNDEELYPGLITAWDNSSFGILAETKYENYITDIYNAMINGDLSIDIHTDNFFNSKGLTLCINSRLPEYIINDVYKKDKSDFKLLFKVNNSNIEEILNKNNKEYLELTPAWSDENELDIVFYLRPKQCQKYKTGWYTLKDLYDWINDTGKIII